MTTPAIDEAIQKTVSAIETMAPRAWAALVQGERVDALGDAASISMFVTVCLGFTAWTYRKGKACQYEPEPWFVSAGILLLAALTASSFLPGKILHAVYAEGYAAWSLVRR